MLDGVPFGSAGWIVGHGDRQGKRVGQLRLEFGLPGIAAIAVAAAGIGQNENPARARVALGTFLIPPVGDGVSGECGSVVGNADDKSATVFGEVINPIGNRDTDGVRAEVVIENTARTAFPTLAWIFEVADQLAFLGVHADDGQVTSLEAPAQLGEIFELQVAIGAGAGGDLLVIDTQRIAHLMEQAPDGVRRDGDAEQEQCLGDPRGTATGPA